MLDRGGELDELPAEGARRGDVELEAILQASRDMGGGLAQGPAVRAWRHEHTALVIGVAVPLDKSGLLKSLQQRGEGAAVEAEAVAQCPHGDGLGCLPQNQHGHVLGISDPQRFQQRSIGTD